MTIDLKLYSDYSKDTADSVRDNEHVIFQTNRVKRGKSPIEAINITII